MTYLEKINAILDSEISKKDKFSKLLKLDYEELLKIPRTEFQNERKIFGVRFIIDRMSTFFITRQIREEDWQHFQPEIVDLISKYISGPELDVEQLSEFQALDSRQMEYIQKLARSGKYDPETVNGWFEMGH